MSEWLPSLLERWALPARQFRGGGAAASVRADVIRNLEWLLNSQASALQNDEELPLAVRRSVYCFGLPCYSGRDEVMQKPTDVAWALHESIVAFEPRIDPGTLSVQVDADPQRPGLNRMRFTIRGMLRAQPDHVELQIQTELDVQGGTGRIIG